MTVKNSLAAARSPTSFGLNIAWIATVLLMLIGGTLAAVKITTDYLLYESATSDARSWAGFMAKSIADLEPIAAGELPSAASMSFFQWAQKSDQVFRYEIFNREVIRSSRRITTRSRCSPCPNTARLRPAPG